MKRIRKDEDTLQILFSRWLDEIGVLYTASCAGMKAHKATAGRMKAMGAKKGFPDIQICEPSRRYHGMFIELKSSTGRPSKEQKAWCDELNYKGYFATIMPHGLNIQEGLEWCRKQVLDYLSIK